MPFPHLPPPNGGSGGKREGGGGRWGGARGRGGGEGIPLLFLLFSVSIKIMFPRADVQRALAW